MREEGRGGCGSVREEGRGRCGSAREWWMTV